MRLRRIALVVLLAVLFGCGSGGGDGKKKPPVEPPPIVCEEGFTLVDGECIPIPPPPPPPPLLRVCLEWEPVIHPDLAGYIIYYAKESIYDTDYWDFEVEVDELYQGVCIENEEFFAPEDIIYFVAVAFSDFDEVSDYSNEVTWEPQ